MACLVIKKILCGPKSWVAVIHVICKAGQLLYDPKDMIIRFINAPLFGPYCFHRKVWAFSLEPYNMYKDLCDCNLRLFEWFLMAITLHWMLPHYPMPFDCVFWCFWRICLILSKQRSCTMPERLSTTLFQISVLTTSRALLIPHLGETL